MKASDSTNARRARFNYWRNLVLFGSAIFVTAMLIFSAKLSHDRAMGLVHPQRSFPLESPLDYDLKSWEEVSFTTNDGINLRGWFVLPEAEANRAVLIGIHGLGSNRGDLLSQAALFSRHGYSVLLLDLRNHGESGGDLTTMGYLEIKDVQAAIDYLQTRPEVANNKIGVFGHSMGAIVAIRSAAETSEIKVIIAESAVTTLVDNISQGVRKLTGLPPIPFAPMVVWFGEREAGVEIDQVRPIDDVVRIHPRAILFIHGEQDDLVEVENSLRLYEAALEPKELYLIAQAGHGGLYEADPDEFRRITIGFLQQHLLSE